MTNDKLIAAWRRKLPNVEPTERELSAFALGVEVGAAPPEAVPVAPDGWVMVPVEPTQAMLDAVQSPGPGLAKPAIDAVTRADWAAMLSAAPPAPAPQAEAVPIDMILHCPSCGMQHIDRDEGQHMAPHGAVWRNPPHRSHLCAGCGHIWRPADVPTNGVAAIKTKGKNDSPAPPAPAPRPAPADRVALALRSIVNHWREFGPEHGFDEAVDRASRALPPSAFAEPSAAELHAARMEHATTYTPGKCETVPAPAEPSEETLQAMSKAFQQYGTWLGDDEPSTLRATWTPVYHAAIGASK